MTTLDALVSRTRLELADAGEGFQVNYLGDGQTDRYTLAGRKVDTDALMVVIDGAIAAPGTDFQLDLEHNAIELTEPLPPGSTLLATGTGFRYFSAAEMAVLVTTAFTQHTHNTGQTMGSLPPVEEQLVAILAVIEGLYILLTDAAYDIDVSTPEGVSIPRHQRFQQLLQMIEERKAQYAQLSQALNVGLLRIEMLNLRRVSRTTGRYVPTFLDRELEDTTGPRRVFAPIDTAGGPPALDSVPDTPLVVVMGEPLDVTMDLGMNLVGARVKVQLRRYKRSAAYRFFAVTVLDAAQGHVVASLTSRDTWALGGGPYWWDVVVYDSLGSPRTLQEGQVEVESRARTP